MTSNDHKLGNPALAAAASRDEEDEDSPYEIHHYEDPYPLGTPTRVIESGRKTLKEFIQALEGETPEQKAFREDDHKENGELYPAVSDEALLAEVNKCMTRCQSAADLRHYSMGLVDRLTPLRSRKLVGMIQEMTSGHYVRIETQNRMEARNAANPYALTSAALSGSILGAVTNAVQAVDAYEAQKKEAVFHLRKFGDVTGEELEKLSRPGGV